MSIEILNTSIPFWLTCIILLSIALILFILFILFNYHLINTQGSRSEIKVLREYHKTRNQKEQSNHVENELKKIIKISLQINTKNKSKNLK